VDNFLADVGACLVAKVLTNVPIKYVGVFQPTVGYELHNIFFVPLMNFVVGENTNDGV